MNRAQLAALRHIAAHNDLPARWNREARFICRVDRLRVSYADILALKRAGLIAPRGCQATDLGREFLSTTTTEVSR